MDVFDIIGPVMVGLSGSFWATGRGHGTDKALVAGLMGFHPELTLMAEQENKAFWQIVLEQDAKEKGLPEKEIFDKMQSVYQIMKETDMSYDAVKSASGMVGTSGRMLEQFHHTAPSLLGDFLQQVMERALKTGECNACMKRIVAAPTAGSCGILPSVLISYQNIKRCNDEELTKALFTAAGIGGVIANKASIAGAQGGCQAEIGSASAMAAGALVQLREETPSRSSMVQLSH